jgi:hypothetical protein
MPYRLALLLIAAGPLLPTGPAQAEAPAHGRLRLTAVAQPASDPRAYLQAARVAVQRNRLDVAQDSLERAETRLLEVAATPAQAPPFVQRAVAEIGTARQSLQVCDRGSATRAINDALLALEPPAAAGAVPRSAATNEPIDLPAPARSPPPVLAAILPPPPPEMLYRQLPGHWQLEGARSVWVEPERKPSPVELRPVVPGTRVWNGDRWVFDPPHFVRDYGR